jgi:uncharacterized protein YfaS (alpha-2-macroglobulin family)
MNFLLKKSKDSNLNSKGREGLPWRSRNMPIERLEIWREKTKSLEIRLKEENLKSVSTKQTIKNSINEINNLKILSTKWEERVISMRENLWS